MPSPAPVDKGLALCVCCAGLMFGVELDTDSPRLLSLGHDRSLVSQSQQQSVMTPRCSYSTKFCNLVFANTLPARHMLALLQFLDYIYFFSSWQVEYDLANSSKDKLILMSSDRVEQSAIPLAMAWYPPLTTESFILLVNNQVWVISFSPPSFSGVLAPRPLFPLVPKAFFSPCRPSQAFLLPLHKGG